MRSAEQERIIREKMKLVAELFLKTNYSDKEIEKATGISSSAVGRYLTSPELATMIGNTLYYQIQEQRKANLLAAKVKGGKVYANNNDALQDENGRFTGSRGK